MVQKEKKNKSIHSTAAVERHQKVSVKLSLVIRGCVTLYCTLWVKKHSHGLFYDNFVELAPILIILSLLHSAEDVIKSKTLWYDHGIDYFINDIRCIKCNSDDDSDVGDGSGDDDDDNDPEGIVMNTKRQALKRVQTLTHLDTWTFDLK